MEELEKIQKILDMESWILRFGSALDLFGGTIPYKNLLCL